MIASTRYIQLEYLVIYGCGIFATYHIGDEYVPSCNDIHQYFCLFEITTNRALQIAIDLWESIESSVRVSLDRFLIFNYEPIIGLYPGEGLLFVHNFLIENEGQYVPFNWDGDTLLTHDSPQASSMSSNVDENEVPIDTFESVISYPSAFPMVLQSPNPHVEEYTINYIP